MAQKIMLVDDLNGATENVSTIHFSVEGTSYEIDLSEDNESAFNDALSPYISAARVTTGWRAPQAPRPAARGRRKASGEVDPKAVRAWLAENNIEVNQRGRIPAGLVAQFQEATAS